MEWYLPALVEWDRERLGGLSEVEFRSSVVGYAVTRGWLVHYELRSGHMRRGVWHSSGPRGMPDLVLAREGQVIIAELKTERGALRPEQRAWLEALGDFGRLWRPRDADSIVSELSA